MESRCSKNCEDLKLKARFSALRMDVLERCVCISIELESKEHRVKVPTDENGWADYDDLRRGIEEVFHKANGDGR